MQISEVSCADSASDISTECEQIQILEQLVTEVEHMAPMISSETVQKLRNLLPSFPAQLNEDQRFRLWKLSYRIWNCCVEMTYNLHPGQEIDEEHAKLRHFASDLLVVAGSVGAVRSSLLKTAMFFYRTGTIWHKLASHGMAAVCYEKATELVNKARDHQAGKLSQAQVKEEEKFLFDLYVARAKTAWELSQKALACSLLGRARSLLQPSTPPDQHEELAEEYLDYGKLLLARSDKQSQAESINYMEQAFEICSEGLSASNDGASLLLEHHQGSVQEKVLSNLKIKILRYLAAGHLQNENYESVLKCVGILKRGPDHASTPFLALKALVGLDRFEEAEKEACILLAQRATPVDICGAAIDVLIESSGHGEDRLKSIKKAFFIAHSRFPTSKELTLRVLEKLLTRPVDQHSKERVEVALSIALDEKVMATLNSSGSGMGNIPALPDSGDDHAGKAQQCLYSLLWNSGSEFFQAKEYKTSIQLFEAALMYLTSDNTDFVQRRAKNLRVLCLCHLGLGQYDRASDYIDEAEKLELNIACAFLKFKICLQTVDEQGAAKQVEQMFKCPDFEADYLTLASHEAISCKCINVAIAALSRMLDMCSSKTFVSWSADTKEVVIIRNIILLSSHELSNPTAALKYFKLARTRLADIGSENFFGSGSMGEKETQWFAGSSWNQGLALAKSQQWDLCADLFLCAVDFYECLPETSENLRMRRTSMLLAVSTMLASSKAEDMHTIKDAALYLDKGRKVHATLRSKEHLTMENDNTDIYLNLLLFEVKGKLKDHKAQLDILYHCSTLSGFQPKFFFTMAWNACDGEANAEVAIAAFNAGLNMTLASGSPDYSIVAATIRKLITLSDSLSSDGLKPLSLYKQAEQILCLGEYPKVEIQWLVSTAWNRACVHVRFSRFALAERWMNQALDLLKYAPFMEMHRPAMLENLSAVLKATGDERVPMDV